MDIIPVQYRGNHRVAEAENQVQESYAVAAIRDLQEQVKAEIERAEAALEGESDIFVFNYAEARLKGLRKLGSRLANAWAEVAGMLDEGDA